MLRDLDYPSDLTDDQWGLIKDLIPKSKPGGRPQTISFRNVFNAILYITRSGCAWRALPKTYPHWRTVYGYFAKWSKWGVFWFIENDLVQKERLRVNKKRYPSVAIVDAQSIGNAYGLDRGYDAIKKVRGRKRNLIVDTMGLIWSCNVASAKQIDSQGGLAALQRADQKFKLSVGKIFADQAYAWPMEYFAEKLYNIKLIQIKKQKFTNGLSSKRWIVERSFAWLMRFRRLSRDYERSPLNSESIVYLAMSSILLRRLRP